jgi:hypothetical protein
MERNFEKTEFEHVAKWLVESGYGFDFFSDRQLQRFTVMKDKVITGGNTYRAILLPANKLIPESSMQKLLALAQQGATILIYKNLPQDVPGLAQLDNRRRLLTQYKEQLQLKVHSGKSQKASFGKGAFFMSDDLEELLDNSDARYDKVENGLSILRRKNDQGHVYFVNNRGEKQIDQWVSLKVDALSAAIFEPMFGATGMAQSKAGGKGDFEVRVQLQPYESIIIQTYGIQKDGHDFFYLEDQGPSQEIKGKWAIEFIDGGPTIPSKAVLDKLGSWTDLNSEDVKNFSGFAGYSIQFNKPAAEASAWVLDLGKVNETAEVILNGKQVATLIGPVFRCVIPNTVLKPVNELRIIVANLMANRIAYMDRNNIPWKIFYNTNMPARRRENLKNGLFDASAWQPLPSGLSGPVTLTPLK